MCHHLDVCVWQRWSGEPLLVVVSLHKSVASQLYGLFDAHLDLVVVLGVQKTNDGTEAVVCVCGRLLRALLLVFVWFLLRCALRVSAQLLSELFEVKVLAERDES